MKPPEESVLILGVYTSSSISAVEFFVLPKRGLMKSPKAAAYVGVNGVDPHSCF